MLYIYSWASVDYTNNAFPNICYLYVRRDFSQICIIYIALYCPLIEVIRFTGLSHILVHLYVATWKLLHVWHILKKNLQTLNYRRTGLMGLGDPLTWLFSLVAPFEESIALFSDKFGKYLVYWKLGDLNSCILSNIYYAKHGYWL